MKLVRVDRVAIVGSRGYADMDEVRRYVDSLPPGTVVVSGGAKGVDSVAEQAARGRELEVDIWPAQWKKYGKSAGFRRNVSIVENSDRVVAFWDGQSRGTAHTIQITRDRGKPIDVRRPRGGSSR